MAATGSKSAHYSAAACTYGVPSYDQGGEPVDVPVVSKNIIRHRGHWGDIGNYTYLRLWAKEEAMNKLWSESTLHALQEAPGTAPQLVDAVLSKLIAALASPKEFEGSPEARKDAVKALRADWPLMIREPLIEDLMARYAKQFAKALAHTPPNAELETRADEIARIRHRPYNQFAYGLHEGYYLHKGTISGDREIVDIRGCSIPGPQNCPLDPTADIWFILKRDPNWIYRSFHGDNYNWFAGEVFREVAESTQLAAEFFPLLLKLAGFSLGLSSRLALILASEILNVLGEQGTRSARGEQMQSALEVIKSVGLDVFVAHFTGRLFGESSAGELAADLDQATERAVAKAKQEVARTDAALVERELRAGNARAVTDPKFVDEGYRLEVEVTSEGQKHTWRQTVEGRWCRFSNEDVCVKTLGAAVDEAAKLEPFERELVEAGYKNELQRNPQLRARMDEIDELRRTNPELANRKAVDLKEALAYVRGRQELVNSLPASATSMQKTRLANILLTAEDAGIQLSEGQIGELSARLKQLRGRDKIDQELSELERSLEGATVAKKRAGQHAKETIAKEATDPSTKIIRGTPGTPHGGEKLPPITENWFKTGSGPLKAQKFYGVSPMPGQIAARLRRLSFDSFDELKQTFWTMVAEEPGLASEFAYDAENLIRMRNGFAPKVPGKALTGGVAEYRRGPGNFVYQLDHRVPLSMGGGLYDLDNLQVVTKRVHDVLGN